MPKPLKTYVTAAEIGRLANTSQKRAVSAMRRLNIHPVGQLVGGSFTAPFFPAGDALDIARRISAKGIDAAPSATN